MIQTVGLSADLADTLADIILKAGETSPITAARIQVILPTRRACITVKNAFLQLSRQRALLLPRLIPLYEVDTLVHDIPPALPKLERTLLLSRFCAAKPNVISSDQAFKMAISLGNLLDEFYQFETDISKLPDLVQNPIFAEHWNETLAFLDIITQEWPKILSERGVIDEADRQVRLIDDYTNRIRGTDTPVIAAGLDGGLPAVRRLLKTVNQLKNGQIIMEGLDTASDPDTISYPPHHYQAGLIRILNELELKPDQVPCLTPETDREVLIREVLKPETQTDEWRTLTIPPAALGQITRIDCETPADEAVSIALTLREVLETPEKTGCLVTPNRHLARRVILEMKRWGVLLDDSAGTPIAQTEIGVFLRLITAVGIGHGSDTDLLALYKHPLTADGQDPISFRQQVRRAEVHARQNHAPLDLTLKTDLTPFVSLFNNSVKTPFQVLLSAHIRTAEQLATGADRTGPQRLWQSEAGQIAFEFLADLAKHADLIGEIEPSAYPAIMDILMGSLTVRPRYGMHPRLDILGPIEARFHHYDVCVIGGLNEGSFPDIPDIGPWLNRPMRRALNLPEPEDKIGTLSLDFAHCFCSPEVILTRSKKEAGTETIQSRFLSRLDAILGATGQTLNRQASNLAKALDEPEEQDPPLRPAPCPPVSARPDKLSVTKIELWMRNPYAIYARYILKLFPLDPLDHPQKQQLYGQAVHRALETFMTQNPNGTEQDLMSLLDQSLTALGLTQADKLFYLNRFEAGARFICRQQSQVRDQIQHILTEQKGRITLDVAGKPFMLEGTADRIDLFDNGTARILDYKTGQVPSQKEVLAGYAPQLPLEALILSQGGFPDISPPPVSQLAYWKLSAKEEDCQAVVLTEKQPADVLVQEALEGLKTLIHVFNQPETKYEACPVAGKEPTYNDYEHLSRFAEWGHGGDE